MVLHVKIECDLRSNVFSNRFKQTLPLSSRECPSSTVFVTKELRIQVAMLDLNETTGKRTKADFAKEYGEDRVIFLTCDVTSDEQLKGRLYFCYVIATEVHAIFFKSRDNGTKLGNW